MACDWRVAVVSFAAALLGGGCSPAFDWREFEPEGSGVVVTFPCRPDHHSRSVRVAGIPARMDMLVCAASDTTFAVAYLDAADPAGVKAALADLRAVAQSNVGGDSAIASPIQVPGMTPSTQAARVRLAGRRPDGSPLQQQAAFFAKGLRVYQASVVGRVLSDDVVDTFFAGLKLAS